MKNIEYYLNEIIDKKMFGGERRTKVYPFPEDKVIVVEKSESDFDRLKDQIKKCKDLGVSIPEYYEYKYNEDSGTCYILEELACGIALDYLIDNKDGQDIVNSIPYNQIEKYINDSYLLEINGIGVEPRRRNIFYDKEKGFTTIDVALFNNSKNKKIDSLESVSHFFQMYKNVLLVNFSEDEYGQSMREKTILNMIKAFENGHPYFKKYSRFIFRNDYEYANILKKIGYDLTLDDDENEKLEYYINSLIEEIVELKISDQEDLFTNSKIGYIDLLSSSISYCQQFKLFDKEKYKLKYYIESCVFSKIKELYIGNSNSDSLKELYYKIRKKEIDPVSIYPDEYLESKIDEELKEIFEFHQHCGKKN